jgi:ribonuclease D
MSLITTNAALKAYCNTLKQSPYITVDTEFMRERTYYAKLCLIQLSAPDKEAVGIDVLAGEEELDLSPIWDLFADKNIVKVFHAARQDLEIVYQLSGTLPAPLFDTQIAAMVCGYGDQVGYEALVNDICKAKADKSSQFTDWSHRPLTQKQITYALNDVIFLKEIYEALKSRLDKKGRGDWVLEETENLVSPSLYQFPPQDAWQRLKLRSPKPRDLAVLRELAAWREEEAQKKDVPRGRILKDETLLDLTYQKPRTEAELVRIRGISADMAKGKFGKLILDAMERGLAIPEADCPAVDKREPLPQKLTPVLEMLKMLLRIQASENDVAARLITSSDDLENYLRNPEDENPLNHGWRKDIFGEVAMEMINGKIALSIEHGKIKKLKIER